MRDALKRLQADMLRGLEMLTREDLDGLGIAGPPLLRLVGIRDRAAVGLALGGAAHGIRTARAVEEGEVKGAASGLAIGLMGVAAALLAPPLVWLLARLW